MKLVISDSLYTNDAPIVSLSLSPDGRIIFVLQNGKVGMVSQETESVLFDARVSVSNAAISPNGEWIAVAPGCEVVQVNTKNKKSTFVFHQIVTQVVFSPTSRLLAVGLSGGQVYIREVFSDKKLGLIEHSPDARAVTAIAINQDDRMVATALTTPEGIYLWDLSGNSSSCVLRSHISMSHEKWWWITHLAFTKEDSSLVCVFPDKIYLINIDEGNRQEIEVDNCTSFALSPSLFAIGTKNGRIQLRAPDGTFVCEKMAHTSPVLHLAFSKDESRLVSSDAKHIKVWDVIRE